MRIGDWKIVANDELSKFELYNVQEDWQEKTDLSAKFPDKLATMKKVIVDLDTEIKAEGPDWWKNEKPRSRKRSKKKG